MNSAVYFDQYLNKNHNSLAQLINRLFEHRSRLLFIRIDFNYLNAYRDAITLEIAQEHRERLLDNRRRNHTLFDHLLGYAWSFERGAYDPIGNRGSTFHHHFLMIYDGAYRQEDITLGVAIGEYWVNVITHGMGHYYVSNYDKKKFTEEGTLGVGMIHRDDLLLRHNLMHHAANYLVNDSSLQDMQSSRTDTGEFRTFGRSKILPPLPDNIPRRGRPPQGIKG